MFFCQISKILKNTFFKKHLRWLFLYILYTHDVTCNRSRWNNGYNNNYKKDKKKLKHFENIVFWNKFYIIFHFLSLCVFISIHNIGRSIPLSVPKYLGTKLFFSLHVNLTYFLKNIPCKKNPLNVKGFFVRISSLRISHRLS